MSATKNKLWQVDMELFASMEGQYQSDNERDFFTEIKYKQEYEPSLSNDLILSEFDNEDKLYLVRLYYDEYILGHGYYPEECDEEIHVMNLSEVLSVHLKDAGFLDRDLTFFQWLRERDYVGVQYDHNYDLM